MVYEVCSDRRRREEDARSLHRSDEQTDRTGAGWKGHLGAKSSKRNWKDCGFHRQRPARPRYGCDSKVDCGCATRTSARKVVVSVFSGRIVGSMKGAVNIKHLTADRRRA